MIEDIKPRIIIASPHKRHDECEKWLRNKLSSWSVRRIKLREECCENLIAGIAPQFIFFPHWSWKIPKNVYENFNCIIFHMTDVPYGRGGSPLQNLIVRGKKETMISALRCVEDLDAGPVYMKKPLSLHGSAAEIFLRAREEIQEMIVEIVTSEPEPTEQEGEITTFERRKPEDGDITGLDDGEKIYDYIRMLDADGYPNAFLETEFLRLEFQAAALKDGEVEAKVKIKVKK